MWAYGNAYDELDSKEGKDKINMRKRYPEMFNKKGEPIEGYADRSGYIEPDFEEDKIIKDIKERILPKK
jgi:hypothetical protein